MPGSPSKFSGIRNANFASFRFNRLLHLTRWKAFNEIVQLLASALVFTVILIPVVVDTLMWIFVIVVGAGNMIIGGLFEAHLDYRIVSFVKRMGNIKLDHLDEEQKLIIKRELLVTIASGNLELDKGSPQTTIRDSITIPAPGQQVHDIDYGDEKGRSRLLNLLGAQSSFGSAVGSPVLFYLGAFVYTILDLRSNPSSEDAAISLGFGIEWMIIVHVAIVSGCLLAANNPSTSSGIVGSDHEALEGSREGDFQTFQRPSTNLANVRPEDGHRNRPLPWWRDGKWISHKLLGWSNAYDTEFQPVSLWGRGTNKKLWIERSQAWRENIGGFADLMVITPWGWFIKILLPALFLIVVPPATRGVVAYYTPPRGLGCRSISFIVYAFCQVMTTLIALMRCAVDDGNKRNPNKTMLQKIFTGWGFKIISAIFWFGSAVAAVGGATMQIVGVYRNCICYTNAKSWWNIQKNNPSINLASDTQDARNSSVYWIWMGTTATIFMAINCYFGWWYQRLIRRRFTDAVKGSEFNSFPFTFTCCFFLQGILQVTYYFSYQTDFCGAKVSLMTQDLRHLQSLIVFS